MSRLQSNAFSAFLIRLAFFILTSTVLAISAFSQPGSTVARGYVRDAQDRALGGVTVTVKETGKTTQTSDTGEFTVVLPASGVAHLVFSLPGHFPVTHAIDVAHPSEMNVVLTASPLVKQEVQVVAPRLNIPLDQNPAATSTVGADVLGSMPRAVAADEALASVPGVKVDNQANQERVHVSIRGQGILTERGLRGIEVLLDGLPLNDPSGFVPDLFDVDWAGVQELHVVRGPVAFLYGGGSAGGVIDITTRTPLDQSHGGLNISGGSNSFYKGRTEFSGKLGGAYTYLSAARTAGDGYRVHTAFYGDNLYGKASFKPFASLQLNVIGSGTAYFNQNPEGLNITQVAQDPRQPNPDALTFNEYQKTKRAMGGLTGQWAATDSQNVSFTFYARRTRFDESVPSSVQHRDFTSPGGSTQYDAALPSGPVIHHLSAGIDLDGQWIDDHRHNNLGDAVEGPLLLSNQSIVQKRTAVFFTDRMGLGTKWSLLGSVRWDRISNRLENHLQLNGLNLSGERSFDRATGRVGFAFNPRSDIGFYTSWGQGFLPPATEELYANPDAIGGFNTRLVPATSWGFEGGMRGSIRERLSYDVAVFHLDTSNDFERYRIAGRPLETFYGNAGQTSRNGLETEVHWLPMDRITIYGAYTYSHFIYTHYDSAVFPGNIVNHWLPNSPNHQLYFDTTVQFPANLFVSVGTQAFSRAFIDPTNAAYIDGYGLLNARVSKQWQHDKTSWKLFVAGRNLTSTRYIAFTEPDPDGNSYQPGTDREIFSGLEIRF